MTGLGMLSPFSLGGPSMGGGLGAMEMGMGMGMGMGLSSGMDNMGMSPEAMEEGMGGGMGQSPMLMELAMLLAMLMELMLGGGMGGASPFGGSGGLGGGSPLGGFGGGSPLGGMPGAFPGASGFPGTRGGGTGGGGTGGGGSATPVGSGTPGSDAASGPQTPQMQNFLKIATAQSGKPYVFGAEGPNAFDCSGLVDYSLNQAGVKVPRLTADGYMNMFSKDTVNKNQLKPGDLLYYYFPSDGTAPGHASHIEIYLGNGKAMGAHDPKDGCGVGNVDWSALIRAERVPQLQQ